MTEELSVAELYDALRTEISDLRMYASQMAEVEKRKGIDGRDREPFAAAAAFEDLRDRLARLLKQYPEKEAI